MIGTLSKSDTNYRTLLDIENMILEIAAVSFLLPVVADLKFPKLFRDFQVVHFYLEFNCIEDLSLLPYTD